MIMSERWFVAIDQATDSVIDTWQDSDAPRSYNIFRVTTYVIDYARDAEDAARLAQEQRYADLGRC
jgi:hypothetical protein